MGSTPVSCARPARFILVLTDNKVRNMMKWCSSERLQTQRVRKVRSPLVAKIYFNMENVV